MQLFHTAPVLPDTKIPAAAQNKTSIVNADLESQSVLTVDYWHLNANTAPLTAVVPNIPKLTATIKEAMYLVFDRVVTDLEETDIITHSHSPLNSSVWPGIKMDRQSWFSVCCKQLHANTVPLTAAVLNFAELVAQIQKMSQSWMAAPDARDMFLWKGRIFYIQGFHYWNTTKCNSCLPGSAIHL